MKNIPPTIDPNNTKGGKHPRDRRNGNAIFPINAPNRPNIKRSDTVKVLFKSKIKNKTKPKILRFSIKYTLMMWEIN